MLANPLKGQVELRAGEDVFILAFPLNTIIALEEHFGREFDAVRDDFVGEKLSRREMRTFIRFALAAHHPEMTDEAAGEVVGRVGLREFGEALARCFISTFGIKVVEGGAAAGPPAEADGTGNDASDSGASSASAPSASSGT